MDGTVELISRTEDGLYRLPAFIDAHVHVESSHLTPARFGHLASIGGGQCVVLNGKVLADLPLPIAGLMSASPAADVAARIEALKTAARQTGTALSDPFATLSFLALPVIPALKLTDRGLFAQ